MVLANDSCGLFTRTINLDFKQFIYCVIGIPFGFIGSGDHAKPKIVSNL